MISETSSEAAFLFKYWFAFLLFLADFFLLKGISGYPARIPIVLALTLWGLFCLTAAEVRGHERYAEYRRFLSWKQVRYDEMRDCRDSWLPGVAFMRLSRFVAPWGKLYFVTVRPAFSGNPKELVAFINARRAGAPIHHMAVNEQDLSKATKKPVQLCALMASVGVVYAFMMSYLFPNFGRPLRTEGFPRWAGALINIWNQAMMWPWAIVTLAVLVFAVVELRFRNRAWILAFAFGALLGSLVVSSIH
jgi:hypothetical protein